MIFLFTGPANDESCLQLLEKSLLPRDWFRRSPISVQTDGGLPQSSLDLTSLEADLLKKRPRGNISAVRELYKVDRRQICAENAHRARIAISLGDKGFRHC